MKRATARKKRLKEETELKLNPIQACPWIRSQSAHFK